MRRIFFGGILMDRQILKAEEVAELLRVDKQRIYELVRTRRIPVIRLGARQYRFSAEAVCMWLNAGGNKDRNGEVGDER
jgi:excisionase family DNA binding protein